MKRESPIDKLYSDIGARIRALRKTLKLTQAQVAEAACIDPSFYGQIERGANIPSLKTFLAVARALKVSPCDLLPDSERQSSSPAQKAVAKLLEDLKPGQKDLVMGMVRDMIERLKP